MNRAEFMQSMAFFHAKTLKKGDVFIHHQEITRKAAFIVSGILRSYYITDNGAEITYCFCTERRFSTSFKSFISQTPSQYIMEASRIGDKEVVSFFSSLVVPPEQAVNPIAITAITVTMINFFIILLFVF
ncbi:hypothetical protein PV783_17010 [Chitinophaga sp. CC14]|uniref:hypothetical protein n=1 Tax=Chitinophaga sp. CC14 TaxID=3029199 RepID=UPI003B7C7680